MVEATTFLWQKKALIYFHDRKIDTIILIIRFRNYFCEYSENAAI